MTTRYFYNSIGAFSLLFMYCKRPLHESRIARIRSTQLHMYQYIRFAFRIGARVRVVCGHEYRARRSLTELRDVDTATGLLHTIDLR